MRAGAAAGLRPWEVMRMTPREMELFLEGNAEWWARVREVAAFVTANLMNVQRSKKTPPVKMEKLLPPADQKRRRRNNGAEPAPNLLGMDPVAARALMRERTQARLDELWSSSPESRRIAAFFDYLHNGVGLDTPEEDAEE